MTATNILVKYYSIMTPNEIVFWAMRSIGWGLIKAVAWFCDGAESAVDKIMSMGGLLTAPSITSFYDEYKAVIWVVLAGSLMFVGILFMLNKLQNRMDVFINFVLALIITVGLPGMMVEANKIITASYDYLNSSNSSSAAAIMKGNIIDLQLLAQNGFTEIPDPKNNIPLSFVGFDINQLITEDDVDGDLAKEVFSHKVEVMADGSIQLTELNDSWIDFFDENYYRYDFDFWSIILTLIITTVVFIFTGIKTARIFYELVVHQFIAAVLAFADIHSGQRLKAVIQSICTSFLTLFFVALLFKLFLLASVWTASLLSGVAYILAIAGLAFAVIDGPNLIERVFGVDAGIKHGFGAFYVARSAARGATRIFRTFSHRHTASRTSDRYQNEAGGDVNQTNNESSPSHHTNSGAGSPSHNGSDNSRNASPVNQPETGAAQTVSANSPVNVYDRSDSRTNIPDNGSDNYPSRAAASPVNNTNGFGQNVPRTEPRSNNAYPNIRTYRLTPDGRISPHTPARQPSQERPAINPVTRPITPQGGKPDGISDSKGDQKRT